MYIRTYICISMFLLLLLFVFVVWGRKMVAKAKDISYYIRTYVYIYNMTDYTPRCTCHTTYVIPRNPTETPKGPPGTPRDPREQQQ